MSLHWSRKAIREALQDIHDQITCKLCSRALRDPRMLECLHVYCQECLETTVPIQSSLLCPSCQKETRLDDAGTAGLPLAHHVHLLLRLWATIDKVSGEGGGATVWCEKCREGAAGAFCLACWQYVCGKCAEVHERWSELASHRLLDLSHVRDGTPELLLSYLRKASPLCHSHGNRELSVYCATCDKLACLKCLSRQGHVGHAYCLVSDAHRPQRATVEETAQTLKGLLAEADAAALRFASCAESISNQREELEGQIRGTVRKLHDELELKRSQFLTQLHQLAQQKLRVLGDQRQRAELARARIEHTLLFAERYLRAERERELVVVSGLVVRCADEMLAEVRSSSSVPLERADMVFCPKGLEEALCASSAAAAVRVTCVSPSHCRICVAADSKEEQKNGGGRGKSFLGPKYSRAVTLTCGSETTFALAVKDEVGEDFIDEPVNVTATLTLREVAVDCAVRRTALGRYDIRCSVPEVTGRGELCVCVNAQPVGGSPVPAIVRLPSRGEGEPVMFARELNLPCGVAVDAQGKVVVVERGRTRVAVFTAFGTRIKTFGSRGSGLGQFVNPDGVTVDANDNILVVDSGNHRIQKFTKEGEFITAVGSKGEGPLQFNLPTNVKVHPKSGHLYVCDQYNHRVQVMGEDFTFVGSFGKEGSKNGQFLYPTDLAIDSSGSIHVVDSKNDRVQVFTRNGQYLGQYGDKCGGDGGKLSAPSSICTDASRDRVYVGERTNCVSAFTSMGKFVASFVRRDSSGGSGSYPPSGQCRVAVHLGLIYVSDFKGGRLEIL